MRGFFVWSGVILSVLLVSAGHGRAEDAASMEIQQLREIIDAQNKVIESLSSRVEALEGKAASPLESPGAAPMPQAAPEPAPAAAPAKASGNVPLNASWNGKDGLTFESEDKKYQIRVGGRTQFDFAWFNNSKDFDTIGAFYPQYGLNNEQDGTELRRGRLHINGKLGSRLSFRAEYDFAANSPGDDAGKVQDAYISYDGIPYLGSLRVGHMKEPFSLEEVVSDNAVPFMENSLLKPFVPGRNVGVLATNSHFNGRMAWSAGAFRETDNWPSDNDSDEDRGWQVTARLTGTPWYRENGRRMLHVGASATHRNIDGGLRFRAKPESNLANYYADTGIFRVDTADAVGLEAAIQVGPWWAQSELVHQSADAFQIGNVDFGAYYVQTGWVITGESRKYRTSEGTFDMLQPARPLSWGETRGFGAWEIAARYSHLDLDDRLVRGGQMTDYTLGLHWYPTANTRILLNYVHSDIENDLYEGSFEVIQTRFQLHF